MTISCDEYIDCTKSQNKNLEKKKDDLKEKNLSLKTELEGLRNELEGLLLKPPSLNEENPPQDNTIENKLDDATSWEEVSSKKKNSPDEQQSLPGKTNIFLNRELFLKVYDKKVTSSFTKAETELLQILEDAYGESDDTDVYRIGDCGKMTTNLITSLSCISEKNPDFKPGHWKNKKGTVTDFATIFNHLNPTFHLVLTGYGTNATVQKV